MVIARRHLVVLLGACLFPQIPAAAADDASLAAQAAELRALYAKSPHLPLEFAELQVHPPAGAPSDWGLEMVSSVAVDRDGLIYLLQRGQKADPIVVVNRDGQVQRSWGKGLYTIPHSIRIGPDGDVWTTDAGSSVVYRFSKTGQQKLRIEVGLPPPPRKEFCGTTDLAFAPDGRVWVSDGYCNARVVEYSASGKKVREWGEKGTGPGQFQVPHGITRDAQGRIWVADRENGRIQWFDESGRYLGEYGHLGKTFAITFLPNGDLWIATQPRNVPNGAEGWMVQVDSKTGRVLGSVPSFGHSIALTKQGEPITGMRPGQVILYRKPTH